MQNLYLTKSDFKVAQTCPTKLYYRKQRYPTINAEDEYLALLSEQGYLIEALARANYPDGQWVGYSQDVESAARETMAALTDSCVLFEATFLSRGKMARVDILVRRGPIIELIEIKSRSFNSRQNDENLRAGKPNLFRAANKATAIRREWRPYLEDAGYQTSILQELFPQADVVPYLLLPDSSAPCAADGLHRRFETRPAGDADEEGEALTAVYTGDPHELRRNPILIRVNVADEVALLMPEIRRQTETYVASLIPSLKRIHTTPSINCRSCEYHVAEGPLRGFHECWGEMADVQPHILDLYRVGDAGGRRERLADTLISQGKASLLDFPEDRLTRRDGTIGETARRQRLQIAYTRANREWMSEELGAILNSLVYPLHFVDFETCTPVVPRYGGMRPFDALAFQWCCQTIATPDAPPQQSEWLQGDEEHPNRAFAESLRHQVGRNGSILVWSSHESTILKAILAQMEETGDGASDLAAWIRETVDSDRLVDLCQLTLRHYLHPRMGGRTTLKIVADAVWRENSRLHRRLPQFWSEDEGELLSPYRALPPLRINGREMSVVEGSGAILAYFQMMDCLADGAADDVEQWRQLLLQYCALDTLAMVMVWWHWRDLIGQAN